jgi:hypothetical protein
MDQCLSNVECIFYNIYQISKLLSVTPHTNDIALLYQEHIQT